MIIADKIKLLRKKKKLSQEQLAEAVGINAAHLSRLENDKYQPSMPVLKKMAEVLEVTVDYLLSEEDEAVPEIKIKNKPLAERIKLIESLDEDDQNALIRVIDSMLTKKKMMAVLTNGSVISEQ
ncbi:MAG: helix-turn-helix transcriptional regulator [Syntrophaceae bacterium]|nr:helix-turn-helix transcriptional regulator [Syntrophaceae bacterium]